MSLKTPNSIGKEICRILGIDPSEVLSVKLESKVGNVEKITFEMICRNNSVSAIADAVRAVTFIEVREDDK